MTCVPDHYRATGCQSPEGVDRLRRLIYTTCPIRRDTGQTTARRGDDPINRTPLRPWQTIAKHTLLDHGRFLVVENHAVQLPNGAIITDWAWIIAPDAAIVVTLVEDGRFLLFRQTKYAVPGTTLAPVGGMLEPHESPRQAAERELLEETGYAAPEWVDLGAYVVDPNRGVGTMHLFLARGAYQVAEAESDDLEDQQLLLLDRAEVEAALRAGDFKVLAWATAVALALLHIDAAGTGTRPR